MHTFSWGFIVCTNDCFYVLWCIRFCVGFIVCTNDLETFLHAPGNSLQIFGDYGFWVERQRERENTQVAAAFTNPEEVEIFSKGKAAVLSVVSMC